MDVDCVQLSRGEFGPVTHVIHIADLHVRTGNSGTARADEYEHVFGAFCDEIASIPAVQAGSALLILAGDVFHTKGRLDSVAGRLFFLWINRLLDLLPMLVICGNHDFRQEDPTFTDMIEMFTAPYSNTTTRFPIHYLRDTGLYVWENIGFGVTSVKDTLMSTSTAGVVADLPPFPNPRALREHGVQCCMALFHGTIAQSTLPSGRAMDAGSAKGYALEWFKGYDMVLLGDNHKQQIHCYEGMMWAYPGSLIQQDFGEPTFGHGYVLWNVQEREGTLHHVANPFGAVTVAKMKGTDDYYVHFSNKNPVKFIDAILHPRMPKRPRVRVFGNQSDAMSVRQLFDAAEFSPSAFVLARGSPPVAGSTVEAPLPGSVEAASESLVALNQPAHWEAFLNGTCQTIASEWIYEPFSLMVPAIAVEGHKDLIASIESRNAKIRTLIECYDQERQRLNTVTHRVVLHAMEWDNLMCFGKGNHFNFQELEGRVGLLNGKNASGKSSFLDVLCIALFGEPTAGRRDINGDALTAKIIYDGKDSGDSACVTLWLWVDDKEYEVHRSFSWAGENKVVAQPKITVVYEVMSETKVAIAEGATVVNRWIHTHIGTVEEMLMSSILCQHDSTNFFYQKPADQRLLLERALHMETITAYQRILEESVKAHKYIVVELSSYHKGLSDSHHVGPSLPRDERVALEGELAAVEQECATLTKELQGWMTKVGEVGADLPTFDPVRLDCARKARDSMGNWSDAERTQCYVARGALQRRFEELMAIRPEALAMDIESWKEVESLRMARDAWREKEPPKPMIPAAEIQEREWDAWVAEQPPNWMANPDGVARAAAKTRMKLAAARNELARLQQTHPTKPAMTGDAAWMDDSHGIDWGKKTNELSLALKEHMLKRPKHWYSLDVCNQSIKAFEDWCAEHTDCTEADRARLAALFAEANAHQGELETCRRMLPPLGMDTAADVRDQIELHTGTTEWGILNQELERLRQEQCIFERPVHDPNAVAAWEKEWAEWEAFTETVSGTPLTTLQEQASTLEARINGHRSLNAAMERKVAMDRELAELEQLEFNPHCAVCQRHPTRVRCLALQKEQRGLKREITGLKKQLGRRRVESENELLALRHSIKLRAAYETRLEHMSVESDAWERAMAAAAAACARETRVLALKEEMQTLAGALWASWNAAYDAARSEVAAAQSGLARIEKYIEAFPRAQEAYEQAKAKLSDAIAANAWSSRLETLEHELARAQWIAWTQWNDHVATLQEYISTLEAGVESRATFVEREKAYRMEMNEVGVRKALAAAWDDWNRTAMAYDWQLDWLDWNHKNSINEAEVRSMETAAALDIELDALHRAQARDRIQALERRLDPLRMQQHTLHERLVHDDAASMAASSKQAHVDAVAGLVVELDTRLRQLMEFQRRFVGEKSEEGFKTHVYKHQVLPLIEKEVNDFISAVDAFRLRINMKGGKFVFYLEDRGSMPPLDHASGYQKFVVGLAMRVALSRIGAVGQNMRHLFVDEGFVACDADNLTKTSEMLQDILLMGGYRSMVLMSHLDVIQDMAQVRVNISRSSNNRCSHIRWGSRVASKPKASRSGMGEMVSKKRGRPRKIPL